MTHNAVVSNYMDFKSYIVLFQNNPYETACDVVWNWGRAFKEAAPRGRQSKSSESMYETMEQKRQGYMDASQDEVSDPDWWANLYYGPAENLYR